MTNTISEVSLVAGVSWVRLGNVLQTDGDVAQEHVGLDEVLDVGGGVGGPVEGEAHGPPVGVQAVPDAAERRGLLARHLPAVV